MNKFMLFLKKLFKIGVKEYEVKNGNELTGEIIDAVEEVLEDETVL